MELASVQNSKIALLGVGTFTCVVEKVFYQGNSTFQKMITGPTLSMLRNNVSVLNTYRVTEYLFT